MVPPKADRMAFTSPRLAAEWAQARWGPMGPSIESRGVEPSRLPNRVMPSTVSSAVLSVRAGWTRATGMPRTVRMASAARPPHASRTLIAPAGSGSGSHGSGAAGETSGFGVEQHGHQLDAGDAVHHAVMDLEDQGPLAALEPLHQPRLPQGPLPVEGLGHEPPHEPVEGAVVAGCGQRGVADVVAEVEVGIVHPHGSAQLERDGAHPLPVAGDEVQLGRDQGGELVHGRRRIGEHTGTGDVHVGDPVLQMEELGVEGVESIHVHPFRGRWSCGRQPSETGSQGRALSNRVFRQNLNRQNLNWGRGRSGSGPWSGSRCSDRRSSPGSSRRRGERSRRCRHDP